MPVLYTYGTHFVITLPLDVSSPNSARPSAVTVLPIKVFFQVSLAFIYFLITLYSEDNVIHDGQQDLNKSRAILHVNLTDYCKTPAAPTQTNGLHLSRKVPQTYQTGCCWHCIQTKYHEVGIRIVATISWSWHQDCSHVGWLIGLTTL